MFCLEALHCLASSYPTQSKLLTPVEEPVLADWSGWYVGVHVGGAIRDGFDRIDCDSTTTGPRSAGPAGGGGEWAATNRMSIGLEYPFVDLGGEDRSITFFGDVTPEIRIRARHHPSEAECQVLTSGLD